MPRGDSYMLISMRWIYLSLGWLSLSLGILGIFLPLLPTTPFLLLAAFAFSKASPRLHVWLLGHRHFGPLIRDWQERRVIPIRAKIIASILMLPLFVKALFFPSWPWGVSAGLVAFGASVLLFLWTRKSA